MKNIQFVSEDQYGMTIAYQENGEIKMALIKEPIAIEIIKSLGVLPTAKFVFSENESQ